MATLKTCIKTPCPNPAIKLHMCEKHYKAWGRVQPQCKAQSCVAVLRPEERKTRGDYCRPHEQLALTRRTSAAKAKTLERFRRSIEPDWVYGCWMWQDQPNTDGYGVVHAGTPWLAHRFSYVWFFGGHARQKTLDHACNRPLCVRPDHLQVVSKTINTARRNKRAFAKPWTPMVLGLVPTSDAADEWAKANGLPSGNPEWWDAHAASLAVVGSTKNWDDFTWI